MEEGRCTLAPARSLARGRGSAGRRAGSLAPPLTPQGGALRGACMRRTRQARALLALLLLLLTAPSLLLVRPAGASGGGGRALLEPPQAQLSPLRHVARLRRGGAPGVRAAWDAARRVYGLPAVPGAQAAALRRFWAEATRGVCVARPQAAASGGEARAVAFARIWKNAGNEVRGRQVHESVYSFW